MKFHNKFYPKIRLVSVMLLCTTLCVPTIAQKKRKKAKAIDVTVVVTDKQGAAIPYAEVVVGEGLIHAKTNAKGEFSFKSMPDDFVTVSLPGYEKNVTLASRLTLDDTVVLEPATFLRSEQDVIPLPYADVYKRNTTGSHFVLTAEDLEKYPSNDLRNALVGLVPGLDVREFEGATGISAEESRGQFGAKTKVGTTMRGTAPLWIIDDILVDITEMPLDPQEVETITFVKDIVGKAMYGAQAANGIIFVKTKRGRANERIINVNVEGGVAFVDRFPEFVTGGDYARLHNQARGNSGLSPLYDDFAIGEYDKNDAYNKIYPSIDFNNMMLKDTKSYQRATVSSTGGNDFVQYYAYLGYSGEGDIYAIGEKADYNRLNARANIDMKVNDYIKVKFDFFGGLSLRNSPNYGYDGDFGKDSDADAQMNINEFTAVINHLTYLPPIAFPVYAAFDEETGLPWYGVNPNYKTNPIGNLVDNGYYTETGRTGAANVALDFNLSHLVKGLKSRTYAGFNIFNLTRIGKAEQYIAYIAKPNEDKTDVSLSKVWDAVDMSGQAKLHDYYSQRFSGYQTFSYDRSFGSHDVQTALTYSLTQIVKNQVENPLRTQNLNWMLSYIYNDKYAVQGALAYVGTQGLVGPNQYNAYPTIGASWILSEENFMKNVSFFDLLKLRTEYGVLGYESLYPMLSQFEDKWLVNSSGSQFGPHSSNKWFGSNVDNQVYRATYNKFGNPDLSWETRKEFTVGLDAYMLKNRLSLEATYYNLTRDNMRIKPENRYPLLTGLMATPYVNAAKSRYTGLELTMRYRDNIGDFRYSVGLTGTVQKGKQLELDEPNYRNDYQYKVGQSTDALYGFVYEGRFESDEAANKVPQLFDESLSAGDLKYADLNNDGVVDDNDQRKIGNTAPRLFYGLNINLSYKNFDLTMVGNGRAFYDVVLNNKYFHNGWGDNNYSTFVRDNVGGDYPKLSYYKVNNNFKTSSYWMRSGSYFKLQNVELGYNMPLTVGNPLGVRGTRFFVRGANLLTISGIKDVDPESLSSGIDRYPLYLTVTAGVKLTF
jgi:TonB-linked SusC/RagA family outer membrane protein